ncbi:hypothetical protein [Thermocatellispora tengchongensis]|uniref:hypothetical protein n=1 Tax=Thermocatellispora tengchongensis TaxID=1073253 RepID=UPI0036355CBA
MPKFATIDEYVASLPEAQRDMAGRLVRLIEEVLPGTGALWHGHPVWSLGDKPGASPVCLIKSYPGHLTFGLWRGLRVTDPSGRLVPGTREMASVKLRAPATSTRPCSPAGSPRRATWKPPRPPDPHAVPGAGRHATTACPARVGGTGDGAPVPARTGTRRPGSSTGRRGSAAGAVGALAAGVRAVRARPASRCRGDRPAAPRADPHGRVFVTRAVALFVTGRRGGARTAGRAGGGDEVRMAGAAHGRVGGELGVEQGASRDVVVLALQQVSR